MGSNSEAKPPHLERAGLHNLSQSLIPQQASQTTKVMTNSSVRYVEQLEALQQGLQDSSTTTGATVITTTTKTTTTQISPVWFRHRPSSPSRHSKQYPLADKPIPEDFLSFMVETQGEVRSSHEDVDTKPVNLQDSLNNDYYLPEPRSLPQPHLVRQAKRQKKRKTLEDTFISTKTAGISSPLEDLEHKDKKARLDTIERAATTYSRTPVTPNQRGRRPRGRLDALQIMQDSPVTSSKDAGRTSTDRPRSIQTKTNDPSTPTYQIQQTTIAVPPSPPSFTEGMVATPPVGDGDVDPLAFSTNSTNSSKTYQSVAESSNGANQDPSLPSPVASPITAPSSLPDLKPDDLSLESSSSQELDVSNSAFDELVLSERDDMVASHLSSHISSIIAYLESLPDKAQKYFLYEMLRRSDTSQLRFIAEHVNPALQCDFVSELPPELSLQIIRYLDVKSLCRAAQVSKRWRAMVDTDEKAWRDLIRQDGFKISLAEVSRAMREGWQWQGLMPYEKDISKEMKVMGFHSQPTQSLSRLLTNGSIPGPQGRSNKRKHATKTEHAHKRRRTSDDHRDDIFRATESPKTLAYDLPEVGLKQLRLPHLYKTLYRRHHATRKMWMDPDARPQHLAFKAHGRHVVTCLQFDDDKILTGSDDTQIHVYNSNNGALRKVLSGHEGGVWALQYDGNTLVSGSTDRTVRVWNLETGKCLHVFHGHTSTVRCLVILRPAVVGYNGDKPIYMPERPIIITGSRDTSLRVWRLPGPDDQPHNQTGDYTGEEMNPYFIRALPGHSSSVRAIAAHGDTLVSGSYDSTVRVWKISTGETVHRLTGHTSKVYSVILDHERNRCISGSMDNLVKVWSLETGQCLLNLEGHTSLVGLLDLSHNRLVSAAADSSLRIWDPETGHCKSTLLAHTGAITCFQHDERKVISGSDRALKLWDVQTGEFVKDLLTDLSGGWQVKFNDRKCVAAVQRAGNTYIEILDFGASRDGVDEDHLGERIVVNQHGVETEDNISDDDTVDD